MKTIRAIAAAIHSEISHGRVMTEKEIAELILDVLNAANAEIVPNRENTIFAEWNWNN